MKLRDVAFALLAGVSLFASNAWAAPEVASSTTGVQGYDLVSYQNSKRPIRGNGHFLSVVDGVTYLFANAENKRRFDRNPDKYLPAYGGYCAFGAAHGGKSDVDPEVWDIVDGKLYLMVSSGTKVIWTKKKMTYIEMANRAWLSIAN